MPNINEELRRLNDAINSKFVPSFTDSNFVEMINDFCYHYQISSVE